MAGPGGAEVGRVSVKVVPDTSSFAAQLRAQLKKLEKQLEATIGVALDTKQALAETAVLKKKIDSTEANIKVGANVAGITRVQNQLGNLNRSTANHLKTFFKDLNRETQVLAIRIRETGRATLDFASHWQRVSAASRTAGRSISRALREKPLVTFARAMISIEENTRGLQRVGRRVRSVGTSVRGLGTALAGGAIKGIGALFTGLGKSVGSATQSLSKIGRTGWMAIGIFAIMAPLIGLVSGLLAGLPSLLAAAGAGFAAIALGMDGIKKAAEAFGPAVESMKATLSQTFQDGLTPVFNQLNGIMPTLEVGLNKVAQGLIPMAQAFTDVVTSAAGMAQIETLLANIGKFFESISPMVSTFTSSFLTLATAGSKSFGVLATTLNDFGSRWNEVVNGITSNGQFEAAMMSLAQVTGALLDSFTRLFQAGVAGFGSMGLPLKSFIDGFTDAMVALMPILTAVSNLLLNVFGAAFSAIGAALTPLIPVFQKLGDMLGTVLVGAINAIVPILVPLADILGVVIMTALKALEPVLPVIVSFLGMLGQIIGTVLNQALIALAPLLQMAGQFLSQLFQAVAPLLPALGQLAMAIIPPLMSILMQLMPVIIQLASAVFPILIQIIQAAIPVILMIVSALTQILPPVIAFVGAIIGALIPVMQGLFAVIQSVWPSIQRIITGVMNIIKGIINVVMGVITGDWTRAWNGVKQILQGAWQAISGAVMAGINLVVTFVREIPGRILGALGNLGSLLWNAGKSIIQGLIDGIKSMVGAAANAVSGVVSKIRNFFPFSPAKEGPFSGKGYTLYSGRALAEDWAKGIEDKAPMAIRAVEDMMKSTNQAASAEWNGHIMSDGFGGVQSAVFDGVMAAFNGSRLQVDGAGMATLVNKVNAKNKRR